MSISSVAQAPNPILASLLSQLTGSAPDDFSPDDSSEVQSPSSGNALTGSTKPTLGGQILQTLISMQQENGASGSTASGADPLQSLFSAMDSNGDGEVSQSEMENTIEQDGGTQSQADALYQLLGGTNSASGSSAGGLSQSQFAVALQQGGSQASAMHHHHHHHGGHGQGGDAGDVLGNILDAADGSANTGTSTSNGANAASTSTSTQSGFVSAANSALSDVTAPFQSLLNEFAQAGSLTNIAV